MLKCILSLMLAATVAHPGGELAFAGAQSGKDKRQVTEVREKVTRRNTENKRVTVRLQSGEKLRGYIEQVGENSFALRNAKTGATTTVAYNDVRQVKGDGLSMGYKILIGVGVIMAVGAVLTRDEVRAGR